MAKVEIDFKEFDRFILVNRHQYGEEAVRDMTIRSLRGTKPLTHKPATPLRKALRDVLRPHQKSPKQRSVVGSIKSEVFFNAVTRLPVMVVGGTYGKDKYGYRLNFLDKGTVFRQTKARWNRGRIPNLRIGERALAKGGLDTAQLYYENLLQALDLKQAAIQERLRAK